MNAVEKGTIEKGEYTFVVSLFGTDVLSSFSL
jgi:hypothetical protein